MKGKALLISFVVIAFIAGGLWFWHSSGNDSEMMHPTTKYAIWAFGLGAISAVSLPLGSLAGILFKPRASVTAAFTAFGAGALMAALSVELIAPTVMEIVGQSASPTGMAHDKSHPFYTLGTLLVGCILGVLLLFFS